jgi:hypothetical protein
LAGIPVTITPDQRLLLRAALDEPESALRCFSDWWGNVDLENTGSTEYRLLPLVYHNIGPLISDKTAAARIKGVAKHVWLSNQINAALATNVLDRLIVAKAPAMIIKGGAMMVAVSGDNTRLMGDCDILVPVDQVPHALATLGEIGLTAPQDVPRFTAADYKILHGLGLFRTGKTEAIIDLHWRPLRIVGAEELTREFFDQSVPCVFSHCQTRRPCFAHMLLHVIVHGAEWAAVPRYDWLADAALILRKAGAGFDWDRLADTAGRYRLGSVVGAALNELARTLDIPIPATALRRLPRGSAIDRAEARWRYTAPARMSVSQRAIMALQRYRRRDLRLAHGSAWLVLPEIWRSVFGPPPRLQMRPVMTADDEDHVIYLTGWSWLEPDGRWTDGPLATLAIQRAPGQKGEFLRVAGFAMQVEPNHPQVVDIYSGWRRLGQLTWQANSGRNCVGGVIQLPPALLGREVLMLQFRIRRSVVPADIGLSEDTRQLGLFLQDIRIISPCVRDAAETPLKLHDDSGDLAVLWSGWSHPEPEGCWTDGPDASLRWTSPRDVPTGACLVIRGTVFAHENEALRGSISINGRLAGDFNQLHGTSGPVDLTVPLLTSPCQREVYVQLHFDNPKSPYEVGLSSDRRKLGLFLQSIRIEADATCIAA